MRAQASAPVHRRPCGSTACIQRMAASRSICGNRSCTEVSCRSKNSMRSRVSNGRTRATLPRQRLQALSYRTVSLVIFQVGVGRIAILPWQRLGVIPSSHDGPLPKSLRLYSCAPRP